MKLFQMWLLCLCLFLCLCVSVGQARRLQQRREANGSVTDDKTSEVEGAGNGEGVGATKNQEFISDTITTEKPKPIMSIKSRAIAMDRGLCLEQSRYHPHYPKCHDYCKRLFHWIGQCWRESCHCIS